MSCSGEAAEEADTDGPTAGGGEKQRLVSQGRSHRLKWSFRAGKKFVWDSLNGNLINEMK